MTDRIRHQVYSIFDERAGVFAQPMIFMSPMQAERAFDVMLRSDPNSIMNKYPEDYKLFKIGIFNDLTGEITPCPHVLILSGSRIDKEVN